MSFLIVDFAFTRFGRKHYGCCVDPLQSLDLVRDALQRYINKEVDDLLQRYRTVKPFEEMTNDIECKKIMCPLNIVELLRARDCQHS